MKGDTLTGGFNLTHLGCHFSTVAASAIFKFRLVTPRKIYKRNLTIHGHMSCFSDYILQLLQLRTLCK